MITRARRAQNAKWVKEMIALIEISNLLWNIKAVMSFYNCRKSKIYFQHLLSIPDIQFCSAPGTALALIDTPFFLPLDFLLFLWAVLDPFFTTLDKLFFPTRLLLLLPIVFFFGFDFILRAAIFGGDNLSVTSPYLQIIEMSNFTNSYTSSM